jgi:hypothetical protein
MSYPPPNWQYPQANWASAAPPARPSSIRNATIAMFLGAVVSAVVGLIAVWRVSVHPVVSTTTAVPVQTLQSINVGSAIFGAVLGVIPWLWMAWKTGTGRGWARVLSTIFFSFESLGLFVVVLVALSHRVVFAYSGVDVFPMIAQWAIGLIAIILLWGRESGNYFAASKAARAMPYYPPPPPPGYGPPGYGPPPYSGNS